MFFRSEEAALSKFDYAATLTASLAYLLYKQRDAVGRFAKGNKGGKGNPFARNVAMMRKCFFNAVTENEMTVLVRLIYHMAMEGDLKAAGLLFKYMIGQPNQYQNPDALDTDEWERRRESYSWSFEELQVMLKGMPSWAFWLPIGFSTGGALSGLSSRKRPSAQLPTSPEMVATASVPDTSTSCQ